ncbi:MAG: MerR family transcriptional regulator [Chloroflexota bacterium]|nr:MerR family transcriptional regulator [Chloroflexota bacterium]
MERINYSLKELCRASGVTERTVRYYITEGLLPPPNGTGPFSRYGYEHWLRLKFILRLKEEYLPLNEIKSLLVDKSVAELETLAQRSGLFGEISAVGGKVGSKDAPENDETFLNLLRSQTSAEARLLRQQMTPYTTESGDLLEEGAEETDDLQTAPKKKEYSKAPFLREEVSQVTSTAPPEPLQPISQNWERIIVAPGIELHVESHIANQHRPALNLLLREIHRLLGK